MISNKKLNPTVAELIIRGKKLKISLVFITPKDVRLNSMHSVIMKIPNKRELREIALNRLSDIGF